MSKHLARKYHVDGTLGPMFDFDPQVDTLGTKPVAQKAIAATPRKRAPRVQVAAVSDVESESEAPSTPSPTLAHAEAIHSRGLISPSVLRQPPVTLSHPLRQRELLMKIHSHAHYCVILNLLRTSPYQFDIQFILDHDGTSPLHAAAAFAHYDLVKQLLRHGASQTTVNAYGESPLTTASIHSYAYTNASYPTLLKLFKPMIKSTDSLGYTFLHHIINRILQGHACAQYYFETFAKWVQKKPARIDDTFLDAKENETGATALIMAVRGRIYRVVEVLVGLGANRELNDHSGRGCAHYSKGDSVMDRLLHGEEGLSGSAWEWNGKIKPSHPVSRLQVFLTMEAEKEEEDKAENSKEE